jgi:hypothetical protein
VLGHMQIRCLTSSYLVHTTSLVNSTSIIYDDSDIESGGLTSGRQT